MKTQRGFYESAQHEVNSGIAVFTVSIRVYNNNNNNNDLVVVVVVKNTRLVAFPIIKNRKLNVYVQNKRHASDRKMQRAFAYI